MDTLGSLCDKISILKIKQWHTVPGAALDELLQQEVELITEINEYANDAATGLIPLRQLTSRAHKVHSVRTEGEEAKSRIGEVMCQLAWVNLQLWHEVDRSYRIDELADEEAKIVVKNLAALNLDRNRFKESIDELFKQLCI